MFLFDFFALFLIRNYTVIMAVSVALNMWNMQVIYAVIVTDFCLQMTTFAFSVYSSLIHNR